MPNFSQTIIIGHLGRDPEVKYLPSGDAVANFSIAVTESWKDKTTGEKKEQTTWFRCNAFAKLAEIVGQYVKKGDPLMVCGRIQTRKWQDKDGQDRESWELRADKIQMLGGKGSGEQSAPRSESAPSQSRNSDAPLGSGVAFDDFEDDIPF